MGNLTLQQTTNGVHWTTIWTESGGRNNTWSRRP